MKKQLLILQALVRLAKFSTGREIRADIEQHGGRIWVGESYIILSHLEDAGHVESIPHIETHFGHEIKNLKFKITRGGRRFLEESEFKLQKAGGKYA